MVGLRQRSLRWATLISGALNLAITSVGSLLLALVLRRCGRREKAPVAAASVIAAVKIISMVGTGFAQRVTATTIASRSIGGTLNEDDEFRRLRKLPAVGIMAGELATERTTLLSKIRTVRCVSFILGACNVGLIVLGGFLMVSIPPGCAGGEKLTFVLVSLVAAVRLMYMGGAARAQRATAAAIISHVLDSSVDVDAVIRLERRMRYKRWLWWTRVGMMITVLQFLAALYLICVVAKDFSFNRNSSKCLGHDSDGKSWKHTFLICFLVLVWVVVIIQCFMGSDVLRWRSFYSTHDAAWKAHYREVFDHGIREVLCCLGRVKYLTVLEEDEVYSVARLLGDLVAYRASGTGHLELLAGLALLQKHKQSPILYSEFVEAPQTQIQEAAVFHQFAEAAYTGPLLDFGRNPVMFPCAWLSRQGVLTPWTRNRRPVLEGDNWWRGHAAAFLNYVNLSPEALRQGRVSQTKREAAYFIVVLHELRSVVIAVRGTETPEDLLTDGLCKECILSEDDLDGLINRDRLPSHVRENVLSTFPHYGHSGIVESARELFMQIGGQPEDKDVSTSEKSGFLSTLLGTGCECHGYNIRIVGHSLGGSVATLLGLRLYGRYPNLHVYAYGPLPCVDSIIAEACSDFVTSIVYDDEFSARLSVNSILRLRAAAVRALSNDSLANSTMVSKLVQRILHVRKYEGNEENQGTSALSLRSGAEIVEDGSHIHKRRHLKYTIKGGAFLCGHAVSCVMNTPECTKSSCVMGDCEVPGLASKARDLSDEEASRWAVGSAQPDQELDRYEASFFDNSGTDVMEGINAYGNSEFLKDGRSDCSHSYKNTFLGSSDDLLSFGDQASPSVNRPFSPIDIPIGESPEMYLPGLIIHIVPEPKRTASQWKGWIVNDTVRDFKAFVANRENFKDIVVSPYMFLDHLPWRCHYAIQRVLETRKRQGQLNDDLFDGEHRV